MDWNDISLVLAVCRSGTLSGAATALGLNYSTVFRRLNAIESQLSVRLFEREPNGYVMTEAGETVMRAAEQMDEQAVTLSRQLLGKDLTLRGKIRITAPEGVSVRVLMPALARFGQDHPEITQDLLVTSGALSLAREADIAVRATRKPPDNYVGYRICAFRFCMYASHDYVKRYPDKPLHEHAWVVTDDGIDFFPAVGRKKSAVRPNITFTTNSAHAALEAVKGGLGVSPLPCFLGDQQPGLVRVTEPPEALTLTLWVLIHPDLKQTARVSALVEVLREALLSQRELFEGALR